MNVKVKICGIRNLQSAQTAVEAGADFLGFNFIPAEKRFIHSSVAKDIIKSIKGKIKTVGVFQNNEIHYVNSIVDELHLDYAQLHGDENVEFVNAMHTNVIKAVHTPEEFYYPCNIFLIDQEKNRKLYPTHNRTCSIMLAGGLNPQNIKKIVREMKPFAVDVARGVETDGITDVRKIKEFVVQAKGEHL